MRGREVECASVEGRARQDRTVVRHAGSPVGEDLGMPFAERCEDARVFAHRRLGGAPLGSRCTRRNAPPRRVARADPGPAGKRRRPRRTGRLSAWAAARSRGGWRLPGSRGLKVSARALDADARALLRVGTRRGAQPASSSPRSRRRSGRQPAHRDATPTADRAPRTGVVALHSGLPRYQLLAVKIELRRLKASAFLRLAHRVRPPTTGQSLRFRSSPPRWCAELHPRSFSVASTECPRLAQPFGTDSAAARGLRAARSPSPGARLPEPRAPQHTLRPAPRTRRGYRAVW